MMLTLIAIDLAVKMHLNSFNLGLGLVTETTSTTVTTSTCGNEGKKKLRIKKVRAKQRSSGEVGRFIWVFVFQVRSNAAFRVSQSEHNKHRLRL